MTRGIAANGEARPSRFAQRGDHVQVERLAERARLLGAVEHGDASARSRQRGDEVARRENGRYSRTLSTPTFSPAADQAVDRLVRRLRARAHDDDHALGVAGAPT